MPNNKPLMIAFHCGGMPFNGNTIPSGKSLGGSESAAFFMAREKPSAVKDRAGASKAPPKVQGSYAGATPDRAKSAQAGKPATRDVPRPQTRDVPKPTPGQGDRGYAKPDAKPAARPQPAERPATAKPMPTSRPAPSGANRTAVSGAKSGNAERAASQRGKQSMPQGARSKGGGGGAKKQKR